jgi:hypothetical protein
MKNHEKTQAVVDHSEELDIPPISFLIDHDACATTSVAGPGGAKLARGDRWPHKIDPDSMTATIEWREGELRIALALRLDAFDDQVWQTFSRLPTVVVVLATPPLAWFVIEASGMHCRASYLIGEDGMPLGTLKRLLDKPSIPRSITFFGIAGDTVRAIKIGFLCERVWSLLREAVNDSDFGPTLEWYCYMLREGAKQPTGSMFVEALSRHLLAQPEAVL